MTESTAVQLVTFLTVVLGFGIQLFREARNRRWDQEDRERKEKEAEKKLEATAARLQEATEKTADKLQAVTEKTATELKEATKVETAQVVERLTEKINVGADNAVSAYNAANNVNIKIESLNQRLVEQATTVAALTKQTVEDLKDSTKEEAVAILDVAKKQMDENTAELSKKIDKSTEHAAAAYHEANTVNLKIESLNQRLVEQAKRTTAVEKKEEAK